MTYNLNLFLMLHSWLARDVVEKTVSSSFPSGELPEVEIPEDCFVCSDHPVTQPNLSLYKKYAYFTVSHTL